MDLRHFNVIKYTVLLSKFNEVHNMGGGDCPLKLHLWSNTQTHVFCVVCLILSIINELNYVKHTLIIFSSNNSLLNVVMKNVKCLSNNISTYLRLLCDIESFISLDNLYCALDKTIQCTNGVTTV